MADAWIPIRHHEDVTPPTEGEEGETVVKPRLPQVVDRHHLPPIPSHFSIKHNIASSTYTLLDTFLHVSPVANTQCTTVDFAHAKKRQSGLKTTGASTQTSRSQNFTHHNIYQHRFSSGAYLADNYS
jgi:hypothetical protein